MKIKSIGWWALAATLIAIAPGLRGPSTQGSRVRIGDIVDDVRRTESSGWGQVQEAIRQVRGQFREYSCEHPLLPPAAALSAGKGYSAQYNGVLREVLTELGFDVEPVFAARTRLRNTPWWHSGHMWLQVTHGGETRDVCAQYSTPEGEILFTPTTEVLPFGARTDVDVRLVLVVTSAYQWWKHTLTGQPVPRWFVHPFGQL